MAQFITFVFTPAGQRDASLAIAGSRAGGVGVLDAELEASLDAVVEDLQRIATHARAVFLAAQASAISLRRAGGMMASAKRLFGTTGSRQGSAPRP